MSMRERLQAALEAGDSQELLRLCRQLDQNLTVTAGRFEGPPHVREMSITHHVSSKPYGLHCLKVCIEKFGPSCLTRKDKLGDTPVHYAAASQGSESMQLIYETLGSQSCFIEKGRFKRTAVHFAAENTLDNSALKWLAQLLGSDCLKVKDEYGDTPVHISAWKQGSDSMQFFKAKLGSDCFHQLGKCGRTAIHWSAMNEISNSALAWLTDECGPDSLMEKDSQGNTAVHLSALMQGEDSMNMIKDKLGCLVFMVKGLNGVTSVHYAAMNTKKNAVLAWCVRELGPRCLVAKDSFEQMPIHLAAQHQDEESMKLAVDKLGQECLTLAGPENRTPVHYAAMNSRSNSALRWIVGQLGAECLQQPDAKANMPLHLAAEHQGVDSLSLIRDSLGVSAFKLKGRSGRTAAHFAAESDAKKEKIDWIVREIGPQCLVVPDEHGLTPAHIAGYYE